ncbi:response regulator [Cohnella silvisoli]|uniref:Response regulator n=1 Tax=Cohnella silvisoli TaxID=2873699 RepID=A0ABV1KN88_9BACL|nr:response regulator [Cohnella silvisoli]MCD9020403.1 response regulator [Cohnella silvisoli]
MYRVLIIDNEPVIVDGLYDLFQDVEHVELGVLKAYSASEALDQLSKHTIDIVFADIHMPGMNGLELQKTITKSWPRCKVIFLTGFNEFAYVQTAMRNGGFDYVLKTEGDERILEALNTAIASIQDYSKTERFIEEARQDMYLAKPLLQKEYVISLLNGERQYSDNIQLRFTELGISLSTAVPLLLIVGRVDEWLDAYTVSDRQLLMFAIHNIAQEYFSYAALVPVSYDPTKFIWLLQPKEAETVNWEKFVRPVHETLDSIQSSSKNVLKITISIVTHSKPCSWNDLPSVFNNLNRLLGRGLGLGKEILLTDSDTAEKTTVPLSLGAGSAGNDPVMPSHRKNIPMLEYYLESGASQEFSSLCRTMLQSAAHDHYAYAEIYYSIATLVLSYLNRMEATKNLLERQDFDGLMQMDDHNTWKAAASYFEGVVDLLFVKRLDEKEEKSHSIITRLQQYIQGNLDNDLSLTRLSEVVYLNASYLSRLYKQTTGHGLAEYIAEKRINKASALLRDTSLKIHEVARQVGLEQGYFIKMFKKYIHMTPQEYRELKG